MIVFFSVLYHPEVNAFNNIQNSMLYGFIPVVYLNHAKQEFVDRLMALDVVVLGRNSNDGLGKAFSVFEDYLIEKKISHYIYFDQDTVVLDSAWEFIMMSYKKMFLEPNVGMLFYGNNKSTYSDIVVSSGSLFSTDIVKKIGNHNDAYFVEGVDYDFCLRLKICNYKIRNIYIEAIDHCALQEKNIIKIFNYYYAFRVYGNSRLCDFNRSHIRLFVDSINAGQYSMALIFIKSFTLFNVRESFSRILKKLL